MSMSMPGPIPAVDAAQLASSLAEKWARLEPLVVAGQRRASPPSLDLTDAELDIVARWADLFQEEIEAVRRARNYITHLNPASVPLSDLIDANEFADRLLQLLVARVPRLGEALDVQLPSTPWWDLPP